MTKWREGVLIAVLAAATTAGDLQAQSMAPAGDEAVRTEQARSLESQAGEAARTQSSFGKAARLYREAAEARSGQPEAVQDLMMAGALSYYTGREGQAIRDLVKAGELALEWGDVMTAAQAFLDAAWVAGKDGRTDDATELGRRAERLSASPLIQRQERSAILSRIGEPQN